MNLNSDYPYGSIEPPNYCVLANNVIFVAFSIASYLVGISAGAHADETVCAPIFAADTVMNKEQTVRIVFGLHRL
jgi:hypothetical protein